MNIYQMYYRNGKKFGFFVQRETWSNTIAKVISIDGVIEGEMIKGKSPYYQNQKVIAEFYNQRNKKDCNNNNIGNTCEMSCPGNFSYIMV